MDVRIAEGVVCKAPFFGDGDDFFSSHAIEELGDLGLGAVAKSFEFTHCFWGFNKLA